MKLPSDKKERTKVLALIAVGVVLAIYGIAAVIVMPLSRIKRERAAAILELDGKLGKARTAVSRMAADRARNSSVLNEIVTTATRGNMVLHDRLGNFLLGASEVVEGHARKCGVPITAPTEIGISQLPQGSSNKDPAAFKSYTAHIGVECGIHDLIRLLSQIETNNPYACISSLAIAAQPDKPEKHSVALDIQWPIWNDPEMPSKLESQFKVLTEAATEPAAPAPPPGGGTGGSTQI